MPSKLAKTSKTKSKPDESVLPKDTTAKHEQPVEQLEVKGDEVVRQPEAANVESLPPSQAIDNTQASALGGSWYERWPKLSRASVLPESPSKEPPSTEHTRVETPPSEPMQRRKPLLSPGSSVRSVPLVATITKLNISSEASKGKEPGNDDGSGTKNADTAVESTDKDITKTTQTAQNPQKDTNLDQQAVTKAKTAAGVMTPISWLSWSRGDKSSLSGITPAPPTITEPGTAVESASEVKLEIAQDSSWYPRWVLGGPYKADPVSSTTPDGAQSSVAKPTDDTAQDSTQDNDKPTMEVKRSSWAFWQNSTMQGQNASGQVAVVDSASSMTGGSLEAQKDLSTIDETKKRPLSQGDEPVRKKQVMTTSPTTKPNGKMTDIQNILLPSFDSTYSVPAHSSSIWEQIGSWLYTNTNPKRPMLLKEPRKIKHALAIGVHGYFPASIVQTVIGKPTGTSIKFADSAAKAIENFSKQHGYSLQSIDKIALEGEGRIEERLEILWKLLLNWIDMIRKADFILVACHSQGVPVAISLVAKLIGFGCVSEARIGICAMAGISRGPFAEYKSRWIGGSAAELFEFSNPQSSVSQAYKNALEAVVKFGVKVVYIGSLDDQLVPLHSSTFTHVDHPNIYRAVFVDGRLHVADFISHLVGFALKLRNLGTSDHGLIRELSGSLAGSLVGGEGHSRIYDDPAVYNLTIDFALRTSDVTGTFEVDDSPNPTTINPYILPFAMRGVLEEELVRKDLSGEVVDLLKQFDHWRPSTKILRDVKYRLEGVRSKL